MPRADSTSPGADSTSPGGSSTSPGMGSTSPGGSSTYPGPDSTHPGGSSTHPGADPSVPNSLSQGPRTLSPSRNSLLPTSSARWARPTPRARRRSKGSGAFLKPRVKTLGWRPLSPRDSQVGGGWSGEPSGVYTHPADPNSTSKSRPAGTRALSPGFQSWVWDRRRTRTVVGAVHRMPSGTPSGRPGWVASRPRLSRSDPSSEPAFPVRSRTLPRNRPPLSRFTLSERRIGLCKQMVHRNN